MHPLRAAVSPQQGWIGLRLAMLAMAVSWMAWSLPAASAQAVGTDASRDAGKILDVAGRVELQPAGTSLWQEAKPLGTLHLGDRLRTGRDSRATLQLLDKSVLRLNQLTVVELQPPTSATAKRRLRLQSGSLFFLNRESPGSIELETPLATGAIRGTEFTLTVSPIDGTTELSLQNGAVDLTGAEGNVGILAGQSVRIQPKVPPVVTAALPLSRLIQWCFYYPAVVDPDDLGLTPGEAADIDASLAAYRAGDVLKALSLLPAAEPQSAAKRTYVTALRLAAGQIDDSIEPGRGTESDPAPLQALRLLAATVRGSPPGGLRPPASVSEWMARSYELQAASRLTEALAAAGEAARLGPGFGFAWARLAELEYSCGRFSAARKALERARTLAPALASAAALEGFIALAEDRPAKALDSFAAALERDGSLPLAWAGRGLALEALRRPEEARQALQVAVALEPHRGLFRSYLAKAWGAGRDDAAATKELAIARELDPADPTAWLYSALQHHQQNRINPAVRDLEESIRLNNNRSMFRSRLLLDQDLSIRSADLGALYGSAGLAEPAERTASRAVAADYANFSGHLFLARSLQLREGPSSVPGRWETARMSELLVANLLAPAGGGNLSTLLTQQDHLQYFEPRAIGASTYSEYLSRGDWLHTGTFFGRLDGLSYALDAYTLGRNGEQEAQSLQQFGYSVQARQRLGPADSVYLQAGYQQSDGGDFTPRYDPSLALRGYSLREIQEPFLTLGLHHQWAPGVHTLLLASRTPDRLALRDPQPGTVFLRQSAGNWLSVEHDPFFELDYESDFVLHTVELQQVLESPHHTLVAGVRHQSGTVDSLARLTRGISGLVQTQSLDESLRMDSVYAYHHWRPVDRVQLTLGLAYEDLTHPLNLDTSPLVSGTRNRSGVSPKAALTVEPWAGGGLRAVWSRSLGGLYFDESLRLEPAQLGGFLTSFRSLIPESDLGSVAGTRFETAGVGFDQRLGQGTYLGLALERLRSTGDRALGVMTNSLVPEPDQPSSLQQDLEYEEGSLSGYVAQLLGHGATLGARHSWVRSDLQARFPSLPRGLPGLESVERNERSILHHTQLFLRHQHDNGLFGQWDSHLYAGRPKGQVPAVAGDTFWQHSLTLGYRFPHRRAELRVGLLNLTGQDYRLTSVPIHDILPRGRVVMASLRLNF